MITTEPSAEAQKEAEIRAYVECYGDRWTTLEFRYLRDALRLIDAAYRRGVEKERRRCSGIVGLWDPLSERWADLPCDHARSREHMIRLINDEASNVLSALAPPQGGS